MLAPISAKARARQLAEREQRAAARRERIAHQRPGPVSGRATTAGGLGRAAPKTVEHRNAHLLAMAKGMRCLLRVPGVCDDRRDTTVACHSNLSIHGKAGARKADDHYTVWGCAACHAWLDQGNASAADKERTFMAGHVRMVEAWRGIATYDPFIKDRDAARWALERLGATPAPQGVNG
jgi:hypothetical protein